MSEKRARKDAKRKKRKAKEARQRNLRHVELHAMRPTFTLDGETSANDFMATMLSPDIPESEWPPERVEDIRERLRRFAETGQTGHVKRRPDGTLTILGDPAWIGPEL
jgi:hypothetical protein